jgi:RNA polymerase sigma-70 factor (ECF subfamily)
MQFVTANFSSRAVYLKADEEDAAAIRQCLEGHTAAFDSLVVRYERVLFRVAVRMLGNTEDARDATQTAFIKAFEQLHRYDPAYRFFSWIYRILANECLNQLRARRPQVEVDAGLAASGGPFEAAEASERRRRVQAAILELAPAYREVVVLRHFAELSYEEIAAALNIPAKTVKSRLHTARQQLGARLFGWSGQ